MPSFDRRATVTSSNATVGDTVIKPKSRAILYAKVGRYFHEKNPPSKFNMRGKPSTSIIKIHKSKEGEIVYWKKNDST